MHHLLPPPEIPALVPEILRVLVTGAVVALSLYATCLGFGLLQLALRP